MSAKLEDQPRQLEISPSYFLTSAELLEQSGAPVNAFGKPGTPDHNPARQVVWRDRRGGGLPFPPCHRRAGLVPKLRLGNALPRSSASPVTADW